MTGGEPPRPALEAEIALWPSSADRRPQAFRAGSDLVLDAPVDHVRALPAGALLDDWLDEAVRIRIDEEAVQRLCGWRQANEQRLTIDGTSLPHVWEFELLSDVFLPTVRVIRGLEVVVRSGDVRRLVCHGLDEQLCGCLRSVLSSAGVEVDARSLGPPPRYPPASAVGRPASVGQRLAMRAAATLGIPGRVKGDVFLMPYWNILSVYERLTGGTDLRPVVDPAYRPRVPSPVLRRGLSRGGWVGHPNEIARLRSRARVKRALAAAASLPEGGDLDRLARRRALTMLEQCAADSLAVVNAKRRAFTRGRIRLAVLPFDSTPDSRIVCQTAREAGIPTVVVQHGFYAEPTSPDKLVADHVALWSERDAAWATVHAPGEPALTGNPGVDWLAEPPSRPRAKPTVTVVLVQAVLRGSVRTDSRTPVRHVEAALDALAESRPGSSVIVRPHPSDLGALTYAELASAQHDIDASVDATSPIEDLIRRADLCVGAVSTAALQAGAAGVPVILLDLGGAYRPWPFDGSQVPVAHSADDLTRLIREQRASGKTPGMEAMREALGVRGDALRNVLQLIERLTGPAVSRGH